MQRLQIDSYPASRAPGVLKAATGLASGDSCRVLNGRGGTP